MTVWLHVTASYFWTRPPVGVIRVERELFAALERRGMDLRYCIFVGGELYEVPANAMADQAARQDSPDTPAALTILGNALREGAKAMFQTLARDYRRMDAALDNFRVLRRRMKHRRPRRPAFPLAKLARGDKFISVGIDANLDYRRLFSMVTREKGCELIGFCHDLIPVTHPEYCGPGDKAKMTEYFSDLFRFSSLVFCNSECTKNDVLDFVKSIEYGPPKIDVLRLGFSLPITVKLDIDPTFECPDTPYILFVSTIDRRKNHRILYNVYNMIARHADFDKLPTICSVGMGGTAVDGLMDDLALNDRISGKFLFRTDVSDATLAALYRNALFCIYPSLYEGWGLPVSEALAFGKAVIASDAGALGEASQGCALHLCPYDTHAWRDAILRMATDGDWRHMWEERARAGFQLHDWDHAARTMWDALNGIEPQPSPAPHPRAASVGPYVLQPSDDPIATAYG